jgi:hypothetical protein
MKFIITYKMLAMLDTARYQILNSILFPSKPTTLRVPVTRLFTFTQHALLSLYAHLKKKICNQHLEIGG